MPRESQLRDAELGATVARLREELHAARPEGLEEPRLGSYLRERRELDRLWAVTAERPYLSRPGQWGRVRGLALVVPKAVLRRLMRWYVEPLATDQRAFNAGVLRLADELAAHLARLDERFERLEQRNREAESDEPGAAH